MPYGPGTYGNKVGRPKKNGKKNGRTVAAANGMKKKPTRYA